MRYTLTADELDLKSSLRSFLASVTSTADYERACESADGFDADLWKRLSAQGWLDLSAMSEEMDTSAWPIAGVIMAEEYGRVPVPGPVELVAGFLLPLLGRLAPGSFGIDPSTGASVDDVPAVWVAPLLPLVFPGHVGPASELVVEETDGGLVLSGELAGVQFGAVAQSLFLPVELAGGWALVRVALSGDGATVRRVETIDPGRSAADVTLASVEIAPGDVVRHDADGLTLAAPLAEALLSYLLFLDGKAIGASEVLLERTVAYVTQREQFGVPIGSFQAVKHKAADMATAIESSRSLASYTAWQVSQGQAARAEAVLASRLHCADAYRRVCELAIQCHGGMGFTWEVGLHVWYRSAFHDAAVADVTLADLARVLGGAA